MRRFLPEHLREPYACGGVILFDGVCNLCDGTMHLVHRFDPGFFVYGQIQSEVCQGRRYFVSFLKELFFDKVL